MRMRENGTTIETSMSTVLEVDDRQHLFRLIFDVLGTKGVVVTDEMIHVSHYGFDDRIGWDEHIIVVDRFGVFGFTDGPCPRSAVNADLISRERTEESSRQLSSAEVESAYGLNK